MRPLDRTWTSGSLKGFGGEVCNVPVKVQCILAPFSRCIVFPGFIIFVANIVQIVFEDNTVSIGMSKIDWWLFLGSPADI